MRSKIKIGTEFTFSNRDEIQCDLQDLNSSRTSTKVKRAGIKLQQYTTSLMNLKNIKMNNVQLNRIIQDTVHPAQKKHLSQDYQAVALLFDLYIKGKQVTWRVNFDLDPFCIELQTQPVTYQFFQNCQHLLDQVIFATASRCGLVPEQDFNFGGGGHICLDVTTAFDNNPLYLRNFMVIYENEILAGVSERAKVLTECLDQPNAPFLHEIDELRLFQNVLVALDSKRYTMLDFVTALHNRVYINLSPQLRDMNVPEEDSIHYQAINLENVLNHNPDERRMEFRRFNAQRNICELLKELDALYSILEEARVSSIVPIKCC